MDVAELVGAARDGDRSAWNALVDRYQGMLWSVTQASPAAALAAAEFVCFGAGGTPCPADRESEGAAPDLRP